MEQVEDELTELEQELDNEFRNNYIKSMAEFVSRNINSVYRYYKNSGDLSLRNIILMSKDDFLLTKQENRQLRLKINKILRQIYNLKIISKEKEKLKFKTYTRK